jgi:AraC-like DNA-binding protein
MHRTLDTTTAGASVKDQRSFWHSAIKSVIYECDMEFEDSESFHGFTECCDLGDVQLTRVKSSPMSYRRHDGHCDGSDPQILVCAPLAGQVELDQLGRRTRARPGQFLLEHSDAPFKFTAENESDLWALRIPEEMLRARARSPSRFCAMQFDAQAGIGKLFSDYVQAAASNISLDVPEVRAIVGVHLADLLAIVLENDPRVLQSTGSAVMNAHLARIEQYLRRHLEVPELSPEMVADACGMSVRYLHQIFKGTGQTLAQWIREHRLALAHESLSRATQKLSISQIAYQHGFNDHAQFSSAFKKKYGCSPSDVLGLRAGKPFI